MNTEIRSEDSPQYQVTPRAPTFLPAPEMEPENTPQTNTALLVIPDWRPVNVDPAHVRLVLQQLQHSSEPSVVRVHRSVVSASRYAIENLLAAVVLADAVVEALRPFAEAEATPSSPCHNGFAPIERCDRCSKILSARKAIAAYEDRL